MFQNLAYLIVAFSNPGVKLPDKNLEITSDDIKNNRLFSCNLDYVKSVDLFNKERHFIVENVMYALKNMITIVLGLLNVLGVET